MSFLLNVGCKVRYRCVWFNSEVVRSVVLSFFVGVLSWFSRFFSYVGFEVV